MIRKATAAGIAIDTTMIAFVKLLGGGGWAGIF